MQMHRKLKLPAAKKYVAERLKISVADLSDEVVMREIREDLDIGIITSVPGSAKGVEAKARIAALLGIEINAVKRFRAKAGF